MNMGLLDSVAGALGGQAGGGLAELLKGQGGIGGLVEKFGSNGMGDLAASWVGKGANLPISPEQISQVLGQGPIADFARSVGISPEQAAETISGLLPEAIDRLTPGGEVTGAEDLLGQLTDKLPGGIGDMIGGFLKK
jgi:uncharacterized protein YidB (DUF937 family)